MRNIRIILATVAVLAVAAPAFGDAPFRRHRYDAINIMPVNRGDIVFVGNSITNMHEWWEAFGSQQRILNRGVSGCVSSETLENIDKVVSGHPAEKIIALNNMYRDLCAREGLTYVDLWSKLVEPGTTHIDPAYTKDGLHLYPSGYRVWCREIAEKEQV